MQLMRGVGRTMTDSARRQLFSVIAFVVGIPVLITGICLCVAILGARAAGQGFAQILSDAVTTAEAGFKASAQLREAADLVIERDPQGGYLLSGKLLPDGRRAASAAEVKAALRALPRRGAAFVTVLEAKSLLSPTTPESKAEQVALEELVRKEGFALVRGSYQPVFVRSGRRPTMR